MCQKGLFMIWGYASQTLMCMWITQGHFKMQILIQEVQGEAKGSYMYNKFPGEESAIVPSHLE